MNERLTSTCSRHIQESPKRPHQPVGADTPPIPSLKMLRWQRQLTQKELAARVGVCPQRISAWETGLAQPRLDHIPQLANSLRVSTQYLLHLFEQRGDTATPSEIRESRQAQRPDVVRGQPLRPSRHEARILAILGSNWMSAARVAARLELSQAAAYQALWRGVKRGWLEHRPGGGYRVKSPDAYPRRQASPPAVGHPSLEKP
jgi:transcriptional regulator with XRE-family HTH domain